MARFANYEGKQVQVLRGARSGDPGYSATMETPQVLVQIDDDTQKVVPESELDQGTYKDKPVTIGRAARLGDPNFDPNGGEQVLVTFSTGETRTVKKADVTEGHNTGFAGTAGGTPAKP